MPDKLSISLCCLITNIKRKPVKMRNHRSGPRAIANRREYIGTLRLNMKYIFYLPLLDRSKGRLGVVTRSQGWG